MATKKQIAEQAMRIISGGHLKPDRTIDIREVMLGLDQIRDARVKLDVYENMKMGNRVVDEEYLSFYESVALATDSVKGLKYFVMPANTISLPYNLGLYQVSPTGDMEAAWIIAQAGEMALYRGTQASLHELQVFCWQVKDRVYIKGVDPSISEVTVLLAASSKDITEDADYPVPPDAEAEILTQLLKLFGIHQQQPHDELEDGQKQ